MTHPGQLIKKISVLMGFLSILTLLSCATRMPFHPESTDYAYISFGNGGGITGAVTQYYLLKNGKVYRNLGMQKDFSQIGRINSLETGQYFNTYSFLNLDQNRTNDPGNLYFFLERYQKNFKHKIIWGGSNTLPEPAIKTYYLNLMKMVNDLTISGNELKKSK